VILFLYGQELEIFVPSNALFATIMGNYGEKRKKGGGQKDQFLPQK
jgi:hypothetical protein